MQRISGFLRKGNLWWVESTNGISHIPQQVRSFSQFKRIDRHNKVAFLQNDEFTYAIMDFRGRFDDSNFRKELDHFSPASQQLASIVSIQKCLPPSFQRCILSPSSYHFYPIMNYSRHIHKSANENVSGEQSRSQNASENRHSSNSKGQGHGNSRRASPRGNPSKGGKSEESTHYSNSFISSVLKQVQEDMAKNAELQKAVEDFRKTQLSQKSHNISSKLSEMTSATASAFDQTKTSTSKMMSSIHKYSENARENCSSAWEKISVAYQEKADKHESLRKVNDATQKLIQQSKNLFGDIYAKAKNISGSDRNAEQKAMRWRQQMAIKRYKAQQSSLKKENQGTIDQESSEDATDQKKKEDGNFSNDEGADEKKVDALIVSTPTAWDRFGSKLRDMPFLQSFYENPVFSRLFGETEIAAVIREMKTIDREFSIYELHELVEGVIAEHIVQSFLLGDETELKIHCSPPAFSVLNASIRERKMNGVVLDSKILNLQSVELVGAKSLQSLSDSMEVHEKQGSAPWFIYSFEVQQINCLRSEKTGEVVEGRIDDIRRVIYSIVVTKHPNPELDGLHYPYMIKEVAIIGSEAVW